MALTPSELDLIEELKLDLDARSMSDELLLRYYQGRQRVEQLGMAIPPNMRRFLVVTNWCRTVVDTINDRQQLRSLIPLGEEVADPALQAIADFNELNTQLSMFQRDRMIYGRGFLSVGSNEDDRALPFIRAESPREIAARWDYRREVITQACRFYGRTSSPYGLAAANGPTNATLYTPDGTVWAARDGAEWVEVDRDMHGLGVVPIEMHLNRRTTGGWTGESQMTDIIPLVDSAARALTNLQFAQEAHGIPRMFMTGVSQGDFLDGDGNPIPQFEAYFDAIHMVTNAQGKVGQLDAADLKNFETSLNIYGTQAAVATGFPARYFGLFSANPPTEGSIRADEARLTRSVESQNEETGTTIGRAASTALRIATGRAVPVRSDWFDPSTPTVSQREDALAKRRAAGVLSREGYWDELGWSEARKAKERAYFEAEQLDPLTRALTNEVTQSANSAQVGA